MIDEILGRASAGENLRQEEAAEAIDLVMQGRVPEPQIGLLLTALHHKGETEDEVAGAAAAMRRHMTPIRCDHETLVDTCGTGGDGSGTFNISTAAALVAAASGVAVAKHGNRRITSKSGSADVLVELGVNVDAGVPTVERCLNELSIGFCFAPLLHQAMKHVAKVRRQLGFPTIFNLLGPLTNPASAPFQVLGVGKPALRPLLAKALGQLGTRKSVVVCGQDGLDEVTLNGPTDVSVVAQGTVEEQQWTPDDFGLEPAELDALQAEGPAASAAIIRQVLDGQPGPARDIVVLNAAAALWVAGVEATRDACANRAAAALDDGAARHLLRQLGELSHQ